MFKDFCHLLSLRNLSLYNFARPFDQVRNCSLEELASALEAFGTLSVRDVKFLRRCSTALAKVCEDRQFQWHLQFLNETI